MSDNGEDPGQLPGSEEPPDRLAQIESIMEHQQREISLLRQKLSSHAGSSVGRRSIPSSSTPSSETSSSSSKISSSTHFRSTRSRRSRHRGTGAHRNHVADIDPGLTSGVGDTVRAHQKTTGLFSKKVITDTRCAL